MSQSSLLTAEVTSGSKDSVHNNRSTLRQVRAALQDHANDVVADMAVARAAELQRRVDRVRRLGGAYAKIDVSNYVQRLLES